MSDQPTIYTNADRTILLTIWPDGTHELALRDEHRRWLPPVTLRPERYTTAELTAQMHALADAEADRKMIAGLRVVE